MKVEVDADELCELRRKAKNYDNSYFIGQSFAGAVIYSSDHDTVIKNLSDVNEKLTKERNWWREQAGWYGCLLDDRTTAIKCLAAKYKNNWVDYLSKSADVLGYEPPSKHNA